MSKTATKPGGGFDADERAKSRESAPVTIGGQMFHRVRKTTKVDRELRRLGREEAKLGRRRDREAKQLSDLEQQLNDATSDTEIEGVEQQIAEVEDRIEEITGALELMSLEMIRMLLGGENGPSDELLTDAFDTRELRALVDWLVTASDDEDRGREGPTKPTPTTGT